jgi:hypothetical protein
MQTMAARQIRLPDRFYLSRTDGTGREVHDVMPWDGAVWYATDGERVGIQYADGRIVWLGDAPPAEDGASGDSGSFAEDFEGVNLDALVAGLHAYVDRHPILKSVWAEDLQQLDSLRGQSEQGS